MENQSAHPLAHLQLQHTMHHGTLNIENQLASATMIITSLVAMCNNSLKWQVRELD
jgi:hypothetical protein